MTTYPWIEGFEYSDEIETRFDFLNAALGGGVGQVYGAYGRRSGRGLKLTSSNGGPSLQLSKTVDAIGALYVGFSYYRQSFSDFAEETFYFRPHTGTTIGTYNCYLWIKASTGAYKVYDQNGAEVASGTLDDYTIENYFELYCSVTGDFKFWVNEELLVDLTGEDFAAGNIQSFAMADKDSGTRDPAAYMDDFYLNDSERIGDIAVIYFPPTSDVSVDFTPSTGSDNYALVDEIPQGDTDYNESAFAGDADIYAHSSTFGSVLGDIALVDVIGRVNVPDGGVGSGIIPKVRLSGVEYDGTQLDGTNITKEFISGRFLLNPATGAAFTQAELEALDGFGWEIGS